MKIKKLRFNRMCNYNLMLIISVKFPITITGECGKDQFMCKSGSDLRVCISNSLVCDNVVHCYDGEDEKDCSKC